MSAGHAPLIIFVIVYVIASGFFIFEGQKLKARNINHGNGKEARGCPKQRRKGYGHVLRNSDEKQGDADGQGRGKHKDQDPDSSPHCARSNPRNSSLSNKHDDEHDGQHLGKHGRSIRSHS